MRNGLLLYGVRYREVRCTQNVAGVVPSLCVCLMRAAASRPQAPYPDRRTITQQTTGNLIAACVLCRTRCCCCRHQQSAHPFSCKCMAVVGDKIQQQTNEHEKQIQHNEFAAGRYCPSSDARGQHLSAFPWVPSQRFSAIVTDPPYTTYLVYSVIGWVGVG